MSGQWVLGSSSRWLVVALAVMLVSLAGCAQATSSVELTVGPGESRFDEPLSIKVTGLEAGASVDLTLQTTDEAGVSWTSEATFTADQDGIVDPGRSAATAGSYVGVWGSGLLAAMEASPAGARFFDWPATGNATIELSVRQDSDTLATATANRTFLPRNAERRTFTMAEDGFAGTYVGLAGASQGPAVMVLGGSEGGDPFFAAEVFAARGIPALSVAYYRAPGLPDALVDIPLEYFDKPLQWLSRQPAVDADRLWVSGTSRGSEAATLIATNQPDLVHGLLAMAPSSAANCGFDPRTGGCFNRSAWEQKGRPLPYTREWNNPTPSDTPQAVFRVEQINGPVATVCGGFDQQWNACRYGEAIHQRLQKQNFRHPRLELSYPDAGHGVGFPVPFQPKVAETPQNAGATLTANDQARADVWPKLLQFINDQR